MNTILDLIDLSEKVRNEIADFIIEKEYSVSHSTVALLSLAAFFSKNTDLKKEVFLYLASEIFDSVPGKEDNGTKQD